MTSRYRVPVNFYIDAESEKDAEDFASDMMCGREIMARMWDIGCAEKKFDHEKESES